MVMPWYSPIDVNGNHRAKPYNYNCKWYNRTEMEHMGLEDEAHWAVVRYYESDDAFQRAANEQ
jgi:uncharacterized protein YodC (DUF2158 family)